MDYQAKASDMEMSSGTVGSSLDKRRSGIDEEYLELLELFRQWGGHVRKQRLEGRHATVFDGNFRDQIRQQP